MKKFYVTFGQKYRHKPHPLQTYPHPDGWLLVSAYDVTEARKKTFGELGQFWSMMYDEDKFHREHFPAGELHRI